MELKPTQHQQNAIDILYDKLKTAYLTHVPTTVSLVGYAGVGKTFSLKFLLNELKPYYKHVSCCAYTASAARVMAEQGLNNVSTIHRLIYKPIMRGGKIEGFERKSKQELQEETSLIVVDEASMVDSNILADLQSFEIPILLVGDGFQLPPLGSTTNPYIATPTAQLHQVMRQAGDSALLKALTELRLTGNEPNLGIHDDNFAVFRKTQADPSWFQQAATEDLSILCGTNKSRQNYNLKVYGRATPAVGDKIVMLKNNYRTGLMNGFDMVVLKCREAFQTRFGTLYTMDLQDFYTGEPYEKQKVIWNDAPKIGEYIPKDYNFATHGASRTTHKSQGQTIEKIIVDKENWFMKTEEDKKRWLYTALSRASKKCVLLI